MVSPCLSHGLGSKAGPSNSIVKWTLPITLLVTVLGFWWHNSRKKKKPPSQSEVEAQSVETKPVERQADSESSLVKANGVVPADATSYPDLNAFIETVIKLNAGTLESGKESNGNIPNGYVAVPSPSKAKRSAPQATPKQNTSPWSEQQVIAKSVKYLDSEKSILDSLEFGVAKIDDKKSNSPVVAAKKKLWSELVEEDSDTEISSSNQFTEQEELQFRLEENCNTKVVRSCDSTTPTLNRTRRSTEDYHNTKSYSESEANEEVSHIISETNTSSSHTKRRDSTSPVVTETTMPVTASPSLSDVHSEGSSDSGKGCSESSRTPAGGSSVSGEPTSPSSWTEYHFVLPQPIVGRLIGKNGAFIHRVRTISHTKIYIKRHPASHKLKLCALEGNQSDIEHALSLIRQKFPISQYPFLTMEKVPFISADTISCALRPEPFHLQLVEGINNDVCISSLVSAGHFFVQLPSHPSHTSLNQLNLMMNTTYSSSQAPLLPAPVENALVAAPAMGGWFRAQILAVDPVTATCTVKFVDYGGYLNLETSALRQIRADFLSLPFQAIECALANIVPANYCSKVNSIVNIQGESTQTETNAESLIIPESECVSSETQDTEADSSSSSLLPVEWSEDARQLVHGLTSGHILQAQVYDYDVNTNIPLVYLYTLRDSEVVLVNQELVERGYAKLNTEAASLISSTEVEVSPSSSTSSGISSPSSESSPLPSSTDLTNST